MTTTWPTLGVGRDRVLVLAALAFMVGADVIVFALGEPSLLLGVLLVLAPVCAIRGSFGAGRGTPVAFGLLWAAFGLAVGLAIVGMFSFGILYLLALPFLVAAIATTPNRSPHRRWAFRYLGVQLLAFIAVGGAVAVAL